MKNMKKISILFVASMCAMSLANTSYSMSETRVSHISQSSSGKPMIVQEAEMKERMRQETTWTDENIRDNPYLYIQFEIERCDTLTKKIEAQNITLVRMGKQATRKSEDAASAIKRYTKFLEDAKKAYNEAEESDSWPAVVNGYEMDEEELMDRIDDALERVELAEVEKKTNSGIAKKVEIRKGELKTKKREITSTRRKLVQQAEQVKMNAALAEISELKEVLGTIQDIMLEIDEDPSKLSIEDLTAEDPKEKRNRRVSDFLNK